MTLVLVAPRPSVRSLPLAPQPSDERFILKGDNPPADISVAPRLSVRFKNRIDWFRVPGISGFFQVLLKDDQWIGREPTAVGLAPGGKARISQEGAKFLRKFGVFRQPDTDAKFVVSSRQVLDQIRMGIFEQGWDTYLEATPLRELYEELVPFGISRLNIATMRIYEPHAAMVLAESWEMQKQHSGKRSVQELTGYVLTRVFRVETSRSVLQTLLRQPAVNVDIRLFWQCSGAVVTDRGFLQRLLT